MTKKKKLKPASIQATKLMAELPERREEIKHKFNLEINF